MMSAWAVCAKGWVQNVCYYSKEKFSFASLVWENTVKTSFQRFLTGLSQTLESLDTVFLSRFILFHYYFVFEGGGYLCFSETRPLFFLAFEERKPAEGCVIMECTWRGEKEEIGDTFHPVLLSVKEEKKGIMTVASLSLFPFIGCTIPFFSWLLLPLYIIMQLYLLKEKKHLVDTMCT